MDFYKQNTLVFFTFPKIKTELNDDGKETKIFDKMPAWKTITKENQAQFQKEEHRCKAIITGEMSGITVIDFDNVNNYNMFVQQFPELNQVLKVKTRRGYHLYFKYNDKLKTNTDVMNIKGVDIRNDGGMIIGPGTTYRTQDGEKHTYELIPGELMDVPSCILANLLPKSIKMEPKPQPKPSHMYKEPTTEEIEKLVSLLKDERATDFEQWRNVGFIINNTLGEDGFEIFDEFSKRTDKKNDYNKTNVFKFYSNIKKRDSGLKIGSLHKMAKEDNPEEYNKAFPKKKSSTNYKDIKEDFEKKHFKIMNPISFAEVDDKELIVRDKTALYTAYENNRFTVVDEEGNKKQYSFISEWLKDADIRTYKKMDFKPCQETPDDIYNLFKGFEVQNKKLKDIDIKTTKMYEHLFNLAGREEASLEYILNCLANVVQKPHDKTRTSLIFRSIEGCGKDTFFNWFGEKILGKQYYINDSKTELIFGRFNSCISRKLLIVLNETSHNDTAKIMDGIKDAITKDTNKIEVKGKEPREEQNNIFYVYFSNSDNPLPLSQTDRRFTAFECNPQIANNTDYFNALYEELESENIDKAFYEYLMKRDIKHYDFTNSRPSTKLYKTMQQRNTPVLALFLADFVDTKKDNTFTGTELWNLFYYYLQENGYKDYKMTNTKFGIDIKAYEGIEKGRGSKGVEYKITIKTLKAYLIKKGFYEELPDFKD
jgi:hypothetical protein